MFYFSINSVTLFRNAKNFLYSRHRRERSLRASLCCKRVGRKHSKDRRNFGIIVAVLEEK